LRFRKAIRWMNRLRARLLVRTRGQILLQALTPAPARLELRRLAMWFPGLVRRPPNCRMPKQKLLGLRLSQPSRPRTRRNATMAEPHSGPLNLLRRTLLQRPSLQRAVLWLTVLRRASCSRTGGTAVLRRVRAAFSSERCLKVCRKEPRLGQVSYISVGAKNKLGVQK